MATTDSSNFSDFTLEEQERLKETIIRAILHGKNDKPKESKGKEGKDYGLHDQRSID